MPLLPKQQSGRFAWFATITLLLHSLGVWVYVAYTRSKGFADIFNHWDASWYSRIAETGYTDPQSWAFYPLYPSIVAILGFLPIPLSSAAWGVLLSSLCLLATVAILARTSELRAPLVPQTNHAWLLALLAPGTMIFFTHHTEGLFLLLMSLALIASTKGKWLPAAVLAGLCALTKNHGVLVAITVGMMNAQQVNGMQSAMKRFLATGLIAGSLFTLWPLYQLIYADNAFAFLAAQANWAHVDSLIGYLQTFWFANPGQNTNTGTLVHHAYFALLCYFSYLLWRQHRPLAFLSIGYLALMPLQGELVNAFRFGAVLWPLHFAGADHLAKRPIVFWIVFALMAFCHHHVTRNYGLGRWSY